MAGKSLIGALRVTLGLDSAEFTKGSSKARKELSSLQKGASAVKGAIVGMIGLETLNQWKTATRSAVDLAGSIGETAQQLGVSTTALQEYEYMAGQAGMSTEEMHKSIGQLTKRLGEAALGAKGPLKALDELGVKIRDSEGKLRSTEAVMLDIADGMAKVKDPTIQAAIANDLFGKSGQLLLPMLTLGAAGLRQMGVDAEKAGLILSEKLIKSADGTSDSLGQMEEAAEKAMAKALLDPANVAAMQNYARATTEAKISLYHFVQWLDSKDAAMEKFAHKRRAEVLGMIKEWATLPGKVMDSVRKLVTGVEQWLGTKMNAVFDGVKKRVDAVGTWFYELYDKVVGHSYIPDMVDEIGVHMARLDAEMVSPTVKATTKAAEAFRTLQQEVSGILSRLFPEQAEANQFAAETKTLNDYYDTLKKRGGDTLQIERQREAAVDALRRAYLGLHRDMAGVEAGGSATLIEAVNGGKSIEDMNEDISDRFAETMGKLKNQSEVAKVQVVESFAQMVDGGLRQLDRFMKGIKSGNWLDIVGGLLGAINGIAGALTGGKGMNLGPFTFGSGGSQVPGFAQGGAMKLGGFRGIDRNMLSLNGSPIARVSESEQLSITPANDRGGGATKIFDMRGAVVTADLLRQMNSLADDRVRVMAPGIARAGASMAVGQMRRAAGRQLA